MRKNDEEQRLFVALPVSDDIKSAIQGLNDKIPQLRFTTNLHLTLRFIGNSSAATQYAATLRKIRLSSFELRTASLGMFRQGVLWLGVAESPGLRNLKAAIDTRLETVGLPPEERKYKPHITLCRLRQHQIKPLREKLDAIPFERSWLVDKFCLYRSILKLGGAIHEILEEVGLARYYNEIVETIGSCDSRWLRLNEHENCAFQANKGSEKF